jgi:hypothetical protein
VQVKTPKKPPTVKLETKYHEAEKRRRVFDKFMLAGMRLLDRAEDVLLEDYRRFASRSDPEMLEDSLSSLATFQLMLGRNVKAERYLREREVLFPASLDAKLQIARYFGQDLRNPRSALRKLRQVRLPKKPTKHDYDAVYNAMNLKGTMLLQTEQASKAEKVMAELAEYTEKHLDQILFFFDLSFVEMMINRCLALARCRDYLTTLRRRKQVIHDQKKTVALLRKVNQLLKP